MRGYWWSPDGDALLVARVDDDPGAALAHRRPGAPGPAARRGRLPGRRHPQRPGRPCRSSPSDGTRTPVALGRRARRVPGRRGVGRPRAADRGAAAGPAGAARAAGRPGHRGHRAAARADRPGLGGHRARGAGAHRGRRAGHHGRRRRRAPAGRRRRSPSPRRRCRCAQVLDVDGDTVLLSGEHRPVLDRAVLAGPRRTASSSSPPSPGVHGGRLAGGTLVVTRQDLDADGTITTVRPRRGGAQMIASLAEAPGLVPRITLLAAGERELRTAVLLPSGHQPGTRLPVLMDPYGGPHAQRVLAARAAHLSSQWFADQGFAVVVVDGRGTPGRGPEFERAVRGDLAGPVLDDQVDALHAVAEQYPDLDLSRVGIRGWSFGGLPGRAGRAAPAGRLPRRGRRRPGDRLGALRHPLHRALPRAPGHRPGRLRPVVADRRRRPAGAAAAAGARAGRRQRGRRAHAAAQLGAAGRRAAAQRAAAVRGHPHDAAGGRGREPAAAAGALPHDALAPARG